MEACTLNNLLCYYIENDVSAKVREGFMIKFCPKHRSSRSQIFFKLGVLKNFANFTGKRLCLESLFNKVLCLKPSFTKHLRWLFLKRVCKGTSLVKILQFTDASERCPLRKKKWKTAIVETFTVSLLSDWNS